MADQTRRPIAARSARWAQACASWLCARGIAPDTISASSIGFAALAGLFLWMAGNASSDGNTGGRPWLLILAAAMILARLLANMFDGMVAVEGGKGGPLGALWNEAPDRIADVLILVGAGAGVAVSGSAGEGQFFWAPSWLGWLAACGALSTAWVRETGARLTGTMDFSGPMAKPHRMFALIGACLGSLLEPLSGSTGWFMGLILWSVTVLTWVTVWRRLVRIAAALKAAP